jgi:hypothetical protein
MEFDRDAENSKHLARHGIGRTQSGRLLTVLNSERRGRVRVVTAYEMTKAQQEMYFEEK